MKIPFTNIEISTSFRFIPKKKPIVKLQSLASPDTPMIPGRSSIPTAETEFFNILDKQLRIVQPGFNFEAIPIIRKLVLTNPDVSQSLDNLVQLGNTGHKIQFDTKVTPEKMDEMRAHLNAKKDWAEGVDGMHGLINKLISQTMIGGALVGEVVPKINLTGVEKIVLINPETIRFAFNRETGKYETLQRSDSFVTAPDTMEGHVKLNPETVKYFAINGDQEIPYGNPPYLASFDSVATQKVMNDNIKFIVEQVGIMGFIEMLMEKPDQNANENDEDYKARLESLLTQAKTRLQEGLRDGANVGYKEDHEFKFHSTSKNVQGLGEIFQQNELNLFSGLKTDPSLAGRSYGTSETQINTVFVKLLSQLQNIQIIIASFVEFAYAMELRMAGFKFETINVKFNKSTVADDLKFQQAEEIKIRNNNALYDQGLISQEQYADRMGITKPDKKEPRVTRDKDVMAPGSKSEDREKKKDTSDRRSRDRDSSKSASMNVVD